MSEETHDAASLGPLAIQSAVIVSGLMGWVLTVCLCFCITDLEAILHTPTGLPAAQIFLNAGGQTGGTIMWGFAILVQFFTGCSAMLADTRMMYAFARDEAVPFSRYTPPIHPPALHTVILIKPISTLSKINSTTKTPLNAVWSVVAASILLTTIAIGSTQTATAIFSITAPALDLSYVSVILAHRVYRDRVPFVEGPFTLGRWRGVVNWVSIVWVVFISTVLFFPPSVPVTVVNMYVVLLNGRSYGDRS